MTTPTEQSTLSDAVVRETYNQMHETALGMGFPSILEALEALARRIEAETVPVTEDAVRRAVMASVRLGAWMNAVLDTPIVCDAMKADIDEWFSAGEPFHALCDTPQPDRVAELTARADAAEAKVAEQAAELRTLRGEQGEEVAAIVAMVRAKSVAITELVTTDGKVTNARASVQLAYAAVQLAYDGIADAIEHGEYKGDKT